jgi:NAD(P)H-dependent FMN reductase
LTSFDVDSIDLKEYDLPVYSMDIENTSGIPSQVEELYEIISSYDNMIIAVNEHNWSLSAFFKNILDWLSRHNSKFLEGKKLFILSTSPGRGGAGFANEYAVKMLPKFGAEVTSHFALASFNHSFSEERGIYDEDQAKAFEKALNTFTESIS